MLELAEPKTISQYIKTVTDSNKNTGKKYACRLRIFQEFWISNYSFPLDDLLLTKLFRVDIYDLLSKFTAFLISRNSITYSNLTIKQYVTTIKNFLEYYDIEISPRKFRLRVRIPKVVKRKKEPLTREIIIKILENCTNFKLKTYVLTLAATGMRAGEACSIRLGDIDFKTHVINIRGEYTKTKEDRYVIMTKELEQSIISYLDYKYRTRIKHTNYNKDSKQLLRLKKSIMFTPQRKDTDLIFASYFDKEDEKPRQSFDSIYVTMAVMFEKLLDRLKVPRETLGKRHKITLHSFRRWVKSTVSDNSGADFSEWFIGHSGSVYYTRSFEDQVETFRKVEPYLTYLDQTALEVRGKNLSDRLDAMTREREQQKSDMDKLKSKMEEYDAILKKFVT